MELTLYLIWALRIAFTIVLFFIWCKYQNTKEETAQAGAGPPKNSYSRGRLLACRRALLTQGCPEQLENLTLKDQTEAPALFASSGRGQRGAPGSRRDPPQRAERPERRERREPRDDREPREPREPRESPKQAEPRESRETREPREPKEPKAPKEPKEPKELKEPKEPRELRETQEEGSSGVEQQEADAVAQPSPLEEKMQLESLLNYVAFNRKEQQRVFLVDDAAPPPPPPKPKKSGAVSSAVSDEAQAALAAQKANEEAQMVLRGALNFKRTDVAKALHDRLVASEVEISESTFALMIEACVLAEDLKSASDFIMKMEAAGYSPATELLDKVMDLYSQQKSQREQEKQAAAVSAAPVAECFAPVTPGVLLAELPPQGAVPLAAPLPSDAILDFILPPTEATEGPRSKLSRDAPIFVPSFGAAPRPDPILLGHAFDAPPVQRTKLTAAARPFEPQLGFGAVPFVPAPWPVGPAGDAGAAVPDFGGPGAAGPQPRGPGRLHGEAKPRQGPSELEDAGERPPRAPAKPASKAAAKGTRAPKAQQKDQPKDQPNDQGEVPGEPTKATGGKAGARAGRAWKPKGEDG